MILTPNIAGKDTVLTNVIATISVPNAVWIDVSGGAGDKIFVCSEYGYPNYTQTITVIDAATNTVLNSTNIGGGYVYYSGLYGFCSNPARPNLLYFMGGRYNQNIYSVTVNSNNTVTVNGGNQAVTNDNNYTPNDMCVNKAGTRLYSTRAVGGANYLWVFDVSSGTTITNVQSYIPASGALSNGYGDQVVVTPNGSKVFVANAWGNTFNAYNCDASGNITSPYATNMAFGWVGYTGGMSASPTNTEIMAWAGAWGRFARFSTSYNYTGNTSADGGRLTAGMHSYCPNDAQYSIDGSMIYLTGEDKLTVARTSATTSVYDGSTTDWRLDSVSIPGANKLVMGKDGTRAYVVGTNTVTVLGPK